jgi:hypothetical protein
MSNEIKALLAKHNEIIVIYADPVGDSNETSVGAFVKMLNKDKDGKLASLLDSILTNLKATCSEKRGRAANQAAIDSQKSSC